MFKHSLLVTTALMVAASVSCLATQPGTAAASRMRNSVVHRDTNDEFLCTYGGFSVRRRFSDYSSSFFSAWTHVAVPVIGRGQTVRSIIVKEGGTAYPFNSEFSVGIYATNPDGFPGKLIAGSTGLARKHCGTVVVYVGPTKLERGTTYWVEETASYIATGSSASVIWSNNPKTKLRAYEQSYFVSSASGSRTHHRSPWMPQATGPYVKLR